MKETYQVIISAVDGSENSRKSFHRALQIAKAVETKLILVSIVDTSKSSSGIRYGIDIVEEEMKEISAKLNDFVKEAEEEYNFTDIEVLVQQGYPKSTLVGTIIPHYNADLIVMGASGYNAIERVLIGSISEFVTRNADCDVLVVR